jgi:hypothetical protein
MIVVNIELWPKGDESRKVSLGRVEMVNDGSGGNGPTGSYDVRAWGRKNRPLRRYARVEEFPRHRLNVHHLLRRALMALGY